jgi:hypothetical protein
MVCIVALGKHKTGKVVTENICILWQVVVGVFIQAFVSWRSTTRQANGYELDILLLN